MTVSKVRSRGGRSDRGGELAGQERPAPLLPPGPPSGLWPVLCHGCSALRGGGGFRDARRAAHPLPGLCGRPARLSAPAEGEAPLCPFGTQTQPICCSFNPWRGGQDGPGGSRSALEEAPVRCPPNLPGIRLSLAEQGSPRASPKEAPHVAGAAASRSGPGTSGSPSPLQVVERSGALLGGGRQVGAPPDSATWTLDAPSKLLTEGTAALSSTQST